MRRLALLIVLYLLIPAAFAAIDVYQFDDPAKEQRFRDLIGELRCPKCQNQNLADSNAPLAQDLRQRAYEMVREGRADDEIVAYMTARYGDFITYRPPLKPVTWPLWFGPFALMAVTALTLGLWIRRRARQPRPELNEQERARLAALLGEGHRK